jgi:hypothetical protein
MADVSRVEEELLLEILDLYSPTDPGLIINREREATARTLESAGFLRINRPGADEPGGLRVFMTPSGARLAQAIARDRRSQPPLVG